MSITLKADRIYLKVAKVYSMKATWQEVPAVYKFSWSKLRKVQVSDTYNKYEIYISYAAHNVVTGELQNLDANYSFGNDYKYRDKVFEQFTKQLLVQDPDTKYANEELEKALSET